jgi:hypothetical protein
VGPGFFALMRLLCLPFSSIQMALIMASFLGFLLSLGLLLKESIKSANQKTLSIFLTFFVLFTHLQVFKDIPWAHFWILPMLLSAVFLMYGDDPKIYKYLGSGFLLGFAWQIRNFETLSVLFGILITEVITIIAAYSRNEAKIKEKLTRLSTTFLGASTSFIFIGLLSGHFAIYQQYGAFKKTTNWVAPLDLNPIHFMNRFIQVFFNPTHHSLSGYYSDSKLDFGKQIIVRGIDLTSYWGQSLVRQQPLLIILMVLSVVVLILSTLQFSKRAMEPRNFALIVSLGLSGFLIIFGYLSQPLMGSGLLKFGIVREFLLPQFLFMLQLIVACNQILNVRAITIWIGTPLLIINLVLPSLPDNSFKDYKFTLSASCGTTKTCSSEIEVLDSKGNWKILDSGTVYIQEDCDSQVIYYYGRSDNFLVNECAGKQTISVLPSSLGLGDSPESHDVLTSKSKIVIK